MRQTLVLPERGPPGPLMSSYRHLKMRTWRSALRQDTQSESAPDQLDEARPGLEGVAVEARHLLVALGDGFELGGRDHVLDAFEALAARALPDLAQDRVGWIGAVGEHDLGRRRIAHRLVLLQRFGRGAQLPDL